MIPREISSEIKRLAKQYPVIVITGPRQSGKTTLVKNLFPQLPYVTLEDPDTRRLAKEDPRGFLKEFPQGAILDEVQRLPDLFSYLQTSVDEKKKSGLYILTGSQQFELMNEVSQSLAGRAAITKLLPLTYHEAIGKKNISLDTMLYRGFYPGIIKNKLNPTEAMSFYVNTYLERDLRKLINIKDLSLFSNFLKLCAGRNGQILNLSSLGNDLGINHSTIKNWLSILEASYIIKLLQPYFQNFNKRLVKSPKIYFLDTALLAYLLGITNEKMISNHPMKGFIYESYVLSEILKNRFNKIRNDNTYYFRDNIGNEVDIILDYGIDFDGLEIKSGQTISSDFFKGILYLERTTKKLKNSYLVYGGKTEYLQRKPMIVSYSGIKRCLRES